MENSQQPTDKKKKPKGPIRTEAVVPSLILFALVFTYFKFFFDHNIKKGIEYVLTQVNGAEVNVSGVKTSFIGGSFSLNGLQVTDKNDPVRNILQVGEMRFKFSWDGLLRAKFVVEDSGIENIETLVQRKTPGRVLPPEPPKTDKGGPSAVAKAQDMVMDQAKEQFAGNALGDLAGLFGSGDPKDQLKNLQGQLASDAKIKELQEEFKKKEALWKERIKNLPNQDKINSLVARAKAIKLDTKNPAALPGQLKEIDALIKEADSTIKTVKEASSAAGQDFSQMDNSYKDLEKLVNQDVADLQKKMKIPDLDVKDLSKNLFGKMFQQKVAGYAKYYEMVKHYMPAPKKDRQAEKKPESLVPPKRNQGITYRFPITKGYPLFWLKKATISSKFNGSNLTGDLAGSLTNVTTSPAQIGIPAKLILKGQFPAQKITGLVIDATMDHTKEAPIETVLVKMASYPVSNQTLSSSNDLKLEMVDAQAALDMRAQLTPDRIDVDANNTFKQLKFNVDAKVKELKEIVSNVTNGLPVIELRAKASGPWSSINWNIDSNLGRELANGFKKELQAKIEAAKKALKDQIDGQIGKQKEQLNKQLNEIKGRIKPELDKRTAEIEKAKRQIDDQKNKGVKSGGKKLEEEGKKLLKQFGL